MAFLHEWEKDIAFLNQLVIMTVTIRKPFWNYIHLLSLSENRYPLEYCSKKLSRALIPGRFFMTPTSILIQLYLIFGSRSQRTFHHFFRLIRENANFRIRLLTDYLRSDQVLVSQDFSATQNERIYLGWISNCCQLHQNFGRSHWIWDRTVKNKATEPKGAVNRTKRCGQPLEWVLDCVAYCKQ